jgi:hypothetical protein
MKKNLRSSWLLLPSTFLMGMVITGGSLIAQQQPSQQQEPSQQQPPSRQAPDQTQPDTQGSQDQTFVGTITKSGDKFVLQDTSGKTWDIDHQELVKKFEGKQVRVTGTLDADGKTIHMK